MRKHAVVLLLLALLLVAATLAAQDEEARRFAEIQGLIEDGLYQQAIGRIEGFLRDFAGSPNVEVLRYRLAELLFRSDRFSEAVGALEAFLREHPASPDADQARFLLASAYRLTERPVRARAEIDALLRRRRLDERLRIAALEKRSEIALELGELEDAQRDLEELVRREETPQRVLELANVYYNLGRLRQAEGTFRRIAADNSLSAADQRTVTLRLALTLYQRDRFREIVELLEPSRQRYRDDDSIMMTLAWALYRLRRYEEAYAVVEGRPLSPDSELAESIREGRSLVMVHEYGAAVAFFERLLSEALPAPALAPAHRALSDAYFALGDLEGGIGTLERMASVLDDDGERFDLWLEIGDAYDSMLGDSAAAVASYRLALAIDPGGEFADEVAAKIVRAQVAMGDVGGAVGSITRFLRDYPRSRFLDEIHFLAGTVYEQSGAHDAALEHYRRIAQERGDSPFRRRAYEAGLALVRGLRRWDEVIAIGSEYLREFPEAERLAGPHLDIALACYQTGDFRQGIDHYERALTAEGGEGGEIGISRVLLEIGWGYYKLGDFERAAAYYSRVVERYPGEPEVEEALYWLGWLAQVDSDLAGANHFFRRLLERFPDSRYAELSLWQVANNHLRRDETGEAIAALGDLVDRYPDGQYTGPARSRLVEAHVAMGNYRSALQSIEAFVEADPTQRISPADMLARGNGLAQAANLEAALQTFRRLLERFPASEVADEATLNIGIIYYQTGDYHRAARELGKLEEFFPDSDRRAAAAYYLGLSLMQLRRYDEAIPQLQYCLDGRGDGEGAEVIYYMIGHAHQQAGRDEEAVEAYRQYLLRLPDPSENLERRIEIAELFARAGHPQEAARQLEGIIEAARDPELIVSAQFALGAVCELMGELERAAVEYLRVTYVHSSSPTAALMARFRAGAVFERLGRLADAINVYRTVADNHAGTRFGEVAAIRIEVLSRLLAAREAEEGEGTSPQEQP